MKVLLDQMTSYLRRTLQTELARPRLWRGAQGIPRHLNESFVIYQSELLGMPCLLVVLRGAAEPTPTELKTHLRLIEAKAALPTIYVQQSIRANERQRLIDQHIAFVVPERQLFLPPLGIDLREHYLARANVDDEVLSPSAQLVFLGQLMRLWPDGLNASDFARLLGYSPMTMSRIKRELQSHTLAGSSLPAGLLWKQAQPILRSPLRQKLWIRNPREEWRGYPLAGLSALAWRTMLSPPKQEVRAIGEQAWRALPGRGQLQVELEYTPDALELELWKYNPQLLNTVETRNPMHADNSNETSVDPYSLYLSLRGHSDERVEIALNEMMENFNV
ncbi:MAG: hypothetical protein V4857_20110 [Pseudomonadota bacterium]